MSENKNFITSKYQIEEMTGKDNTLIIRRKDGIIIAFIEVKDNRLVSFRRHENRKVSINFLNKFASYVKKQGYKLNIGVSKEIGMSIVRDATGRQTYITSDELKKYGLEKYVQTGETYQININNLWYIISNLYKRAYRPYYFTSNIFKLGTLHIGHILGTSFPIYT